MNSTTIIIFSLLAIATLIGAYLFSKSKDQLKADSSTKAKSSRHGDLQQLSPKELKILAKAKSIAKSGNVQGGALLLEQSGLFRQCISLYEDAGMIDEAASVLLRMQRPHRAGFIFARHGKWNQASQCFKTAGLYAEAARCMREAGNYDEAAEYFLKATRQEDATSCYLLAGKYHQAGKAFLKSNQSDKAKICYDKLMSNPKSIQSIKFEEFELDFLCTIVGLGPVSTGYVDLLSKSGRLIGLILGLIQANEISTASALYLKSAVDHGPLLISKINFQTDSARKLAELFHQVAQFKYAGIVFEQCADFSRAASAFEQAEEWERSSICYDKIGDPAKADFVRRKINSSPVATPPNGEKLHDFESVSSTMAFRENEMPQPDESKKIKPISVKRKPVDAGFFTLEGVAQDSAETPLVSLSGSNSSENGDRMALHKCPTFLDLTYEQKEKIWALCTIENVPQDSIIVDWKDEPAGLYLVLEGSVVGHLEKPNKITFSSEIEQPFSAGMVFGELWLLVEHPARIRFVASVKSRLIFIERSRFNDLLEQDGSIARKVYKYFTHRLLSKILNPLNSQEIKQAS